MHPQLCAARFDKDLAGITPELCELRGWTVFCKEYPLFDVGFTSPKGAQLRLQVKADDWDATPASFTLLKWDGTFMTAAPASKKNIFNSSNHRYTGRIFICIRGTREYHTHESHVGEKWELLRGKPEYRLGELVTQIWNGWRKANP